MNHPAGLRRDTPTALAVLGGDALNASSHSCGLLAASPSPEHTVLEKPGLSGLIHRSFTPCQGLLPLSYPPLNWLALVGATGGCDPDRNPFGGIVVTRTTLVEKRITPLIDAVFRSVDTSEFQLALPTEDVAADVDAIQEGFSLQRIRRFYRQRHWRDETTEADYSDRVEPGLKLENVAAHSWHVADTAHLLVGHFPDLDLGRVVLLAVLHDKLEIYTGDYDPVGPDGQGTGTHAFDDVARQDKQVAEARAAEHYLAKLRPSAREWQRQLLNEMIAGKSPEARFVKAVDKLQALAYVLEKKGGTLDDEHLAFTVMYSRKALDAFPKIRFHYAELLDRFLDAVADTRNVSRDELDRKVFGQLELRL